MIFHENRLLADDSYDISYLFFTKIRKGVAKFFAAAVVIGALRSKEIEMYMGNLKIYGKSSCVEFFDKFFQEYHQSVKLILIKLSGLIWVKTVCKCY